jgi:hypothetical protein
MTLSRTALYSTPARRAKVEKHNARAARLGKLLSGLNFPEEWDLSKPHVVPKA